MATIALELPIFVPQATARIAAFARSSIGNRPQRQASNRPSTNWRRHLLRGLEVSRSRGLEWKERVSTSCRRQFLLVLLSATAATFVGRDGDEAQAAGTSSSAGLNEAQAVIVGEEETIGDLFGFDGLGQRPEEYALGKVVALAQAGDGAVVFLGVDGFEIPLQLVVGPAEAMAVLTAVQERKSRRPVTHEAWGLSLAAVGWKVDRVVITGIEKDIFYSNVVLSNLSQLLTIPSNKKSVEMRPSDAIALALRCRAPLFVHRKVAEDILGPKEDLASKLKVDPLKQPSLQA